MLLMDLHENILNIQCLRLRFFGNEILLIRGTVFPSSIYAGDSSY